MKYLIIDKNVTKEYFQAIVIPYLDVQIIQWLCMHPPHS